jgi:hypothetical protein
MRFFLLLITWLLSAALVVHHRRDAFYDVDEGLLGETAERVMHGQLPHRDFSDLYTGALGAFDAVGFRLWGTSADTLRTVLVIVTLLWIPVLFFVAERLARPGPRAPWAAALAVLTAVWWSVPNHPRGMPSWYTLFCATAGAAAVLRYIDTRHRRWMLIAGVAAGISCTVKIVGLYLIAAVLLFAVFDEQEADRVVAGPPPLNWYTVLVDLAVALYAVAVVLLVRSQGLDALVHYALPSAAMAALLIWREHTAPHAAPLVRASYLLSRLVPFAAGVAIPVALLLVPYIRAGAVGALVHGVFVVPMVRLGHIEVPPPPAVTVLAAVPILAALALIGRRWPWRLALATLALLIVAATGWLQPFSDPALRTPLHVVSRLARFAERGLIPLLVVVGAVVLARRRTAIDARAVALVLCVLATGALVQFPYALDQYFFFVAPLVVLAALALAPPRAASIVAVACLLFAGARLDWVSHWPLVPLDIPRGGPLIAADLNTMYKDMVATVRAHAHGEYIYAGPDSPHVYFFTGYQNPTPTLYEIFDDTTGQTARVLHAIDAHGITTVVLNMRSGNVSGRIDPALQAALVARFPLSSTVGGYVIRWR